MFDTLRRLLCLTTLLLTGSLAAAATADSPIATINAHRILAESKVAKDAQARFVADFQPRDQELKTLADTLREKSADLEKNGASMAPSQLIAAQSAVAELSRDFNRRQQQFVEDRDARKRDDIQHVFEIANQAVRKFAPTAHIDIVFQDVVYANPSTDITSQVIEIMDSDAAK